MKRILSGAIAGLLALTPSLAWGTPAAPDPACAESLFSVAAQIQSVLPSTGSVTIHRSDGSTRVGHRWSCIRYGEVLTLPEGVDSVYLFAKGRTTAITRSDPPFGPTGPILSVLGAAERYLTNLLGRVDAWSVPTSSRGSEGGDDHRKQVALTLLMGADNIQRFAPELAGGRAFLAAERGTSPRKCLGGATTETGGAHDAVFCDLSLAARPVRVALRDGRDEEVAFRLTYVAPVVVPRPAWLNDPSRATPEERVAWGVWLIDDEGIGTQWRLLGLSMIAAQRRTVWAAGAMLRNVGVMD